MESFRGVVIEIRKITAEFVNYKTGIGAEYRHEAFIESKDFDRWVKFDPRKLPTEVFVGDEVVFEISDRSKMDFPKAYRVWLLTVRK
jgi:hypothetical protein